MGTPRSNASSGPNPRTHRRPPSIGNLHYKVAVLLIALIVVGAGLVYGLNVTHRSPTPPGATPGDSVLLPTPIQHLIVIFLENHPQSETLANGSFERYLAQQYAFAAGFHGMTFDSLQDYAFATSGSYYFNGGNVASLVDAKGETWAAYMQSMPTPCDKNPSANGLYDPDHDPFIYYTTVTASPTYCASHVLPLTAWYQALGNGSLPNYVFIAPDILNDSDKVSVTFCDAWLHGFLSDFMNSSAFASSAVVVTYDSDAPEAPPPGTTGNGLVYFAVVSPFANRFYTSPNFYDDDNLFTTTEWLLGLGHTNHNDNWNLDPPIIDLFDFSPTHFVNGTVLYQGAAVAGAVVSGNGYAVRTDASGSFSLPLPNGTYLLSAGGSNGSCSSATTPVSVTGRALNLSFDLPCA